jgi:hypothetical protein
MNGRNKASRILISSGATVLLVAALLHLSDYPKDLRAIAASNLRASMQGEVRSLFFLVGWDWLAIAIIMLISAVAGQELRKVVVLFCGFALLVTLAVIVAFMGWFWGCGLIILSALIILCGGVLFRNTAD